MTAPRMASSSILDLSGGAAGVVTAQTRDAGQSGATRADLGIGYSRLGKLTDWRWCFHAAFALFAATLLIQAWHFGRSRGQATKAGER